jgi:SAM-dependent methyltransferase
MKEKFSKHYDGDYFNWQSSIGEFGGWANKTKFSKYISEDHTVLDFGCGGGFLLKQLNCKNRIGVEINPSAAEQARQNGVKVYSDAQDVPDNSVDIIISNNALEHTFRPLDELKELKSKLKSGGKIIFVVPCESISYNYVSKNVNHHLYSWSPMCLGNMFTEAGYSLIESKPYIHKWPPKYDLIAKIGGRKLFELACRIYGRIDRSWFQVRAIGGVIE